MTTKLTTRAGGMAERKVIPQPDGSSLVQIKIDLGKLPSPERSYLAERVGFEFVSDEVRLLFAQNVVGGEELRSLLIVSMFPEAVRAFVQGNAEFWPSLQSMMERNEGVEAPLLKVQSEPKHVVSLRANLVAASYSGREAGLQFFHIGPHDVHRFSVTRGEPNIEPVVRVDLSTAMLQAIMRAAKGADLPEDWK